jgi:N-acyl-D-aspartate/D-glutamate deacylase
MAAETGRNVTFALTQNNADPTAWRKVLEQSLLTPGVRPQVHGRTVSILLGFSTFHPFNFTAAWSSSGLATAPWREQVARLQADGSLRAALAADARALDDDPIVQGFMGPARVYLLGDPPDYEPGPERSVTAIAASRGAGVWETFLDLLLVDDGRELLNSPVLNYSDGNLEPVREMLLHPTSAFGLGDGGAHAGQTCDASTTTYLLSYWARDRAHGRLPVELAVHKITQATATLYGLGDRGVLAPGYVGDLNVIDHDRLTLRRPHMVEDLPGGAARLIQRADGYVATVKSGQQTFAEGEHTGAVPGALLRGAR